MREGGRMAPQNLPNAAKTGAIKGLKRPLPKPKTGFSADLSCRLLRRNDDGSLCFAFDNLDKRFCKPIRREYIDSIGKDLSSCRTILLPRVSKPPGAFGIIFPRRKTYKRERQQGGHHRRAERLRRSEDRPLRPAHARQPTRASHLRKTETEGLSQ